MTRVLARVLTQVLIRVPTRVPMRAARWLLYAYIRTFANLPAPYHGWMLAQHPDPHQIRLENVLSALSNPLRLKIVRFLASGGEHACGTVLDGVSKSTLTRHWQVLRDSGVIWQRPYGRENLLSLRRDDLDARFPGLLDAVLAAAARNDSEPAQP